jgi:hypothetical protein
MRRADPRLAQPVTLVGHGLHMGEVLERFAELSGVDIAASGTDGAADVRVSVVLREVPLADAMDAAWSLVSYRGARWHWSRSGKPAAYRYVLMCPRAAQLVAERLRHETRTRFELHAQRMLAALDMTPEERRALEREERSVKVFEDSRTLDSGLRAFREMLTPEQQQALLRGGGRILMPLAEAPEHVQEFARKEWEFAFSYPGAPPVSQRIPPPTSIRFEVMHRSGRLSPVLFIGFNIGAYGYLGGRPFQDQLCEGLYELWLQPGDSRRDPRDDSAVKSSPSQAKPADTQPIAARLEELAAAVPLALIARLDPQDRRDPGSPDGKTVAAYLAQIVRNYHAKWRNGVLLITHVAWFDPTLRAAEVPLAEMKHLREARDANGGLLPVPEIARAVSRLGDQQLLALAEELPSLRPGVYWRPVFELYASSRSLAEGLTSRRGLPLELARRALERISEVGLNRVLAREPSATVRLREERSLGQQQMWVEVLGGRGEVLFQRGYTYKLKTP